MCAEIWTVQELPIIFKEWTETGSDASELKDVHSLYSTTYYYDQ